MNQKFFVPRGTADILPDTIALWENLETTARRILKSYGYREIRTPMYEETALFKRSLGQTSDIVNKQLLELATEKEEGYALRPEGTAAVVRSYIENSFDKKEPLSKLFYIGPMFRGERPQKGRLRQFHQIGVEAIGPNSISDFLDAEVIALAMHLLKDFGVQNPKLKINSLGSKEDKEHISIWLRQEFSKYKNDLCEECQSRYERNVFRVLDCKNESCKKIAHHQVLGKNKDLLSLPGVSGASRLHFEGIQRVLNQLEIEYEVSPHLVRGLDYYEFTVFEITAGGSLGSQDAVGAGGRYSDLVVELGGDAKANIGAFGFALGVERILLASEAIQNKVEGIDVYVVIKTPGSEYQQKAFKILDSLRKAGISADMSYNSKKIDAQLNRANKLNARFAVILMEDYTIAVKDMRTSEQMPVGQDIVEVIKSKLI